MPARTACPVAALSRWCASRAWRHAGLGREDMLVLGVLIVYSMMAGIYLEGPKPSRLGRSLAGGLASVSQNTLQQPLGRDGNRAVAWAEGRSAPDVLGTLAFVGVCAAVTARLHLSAAPRSGVAAHGCARRCSVASARPSARGQRKTAGAARSRPSSIEWPQGCAGWGLRRRAAAWHTEQDAEAACGV